MTANTATCARDASFDELFEMLSVAPRRRILAALKKRNPRQEDEFETQAFARNDEFERYVLELTHNHLPELDAANFIDWDRETDTIVRGSRFEEIEPLLRLLQEHQDELPDDWP